MHDEIYAKDQQIGNWEDTINYLRECYNHHTTRPDLDNVIMIVRKHTSKDNYEHFDYQYYVAAIYRREPTTKIQ